MLAVNFPRVFLSSLCKNGRAPQCFRVDMNYNIQNRFANLTAPHRPLSTVIPPLAEIVYSAIQSVKEYVTASQTSKTTIGSRQIHSLEIGVHSALFELVRAFEAGGNTDKHKIVQDLAELTESLDAAVVKELFTVACIVHPHGVNFATECRARAGAAGNIAHYTQLSKLLEPLLTVWYGAGFLELREINWDSPGRTLEWIAKHESVHPTDQLGRFKQRFEGHLRCYGLFHTSESWKPVAFVHASLTNRPADRLDHIWTTPEGDGVPDKAVFYSISGSHPGLKGIGVPRQLLYRVKAHIHKEFPTITRYLTLSPVPLLCKWMHQQMSLSQPWPQQDLTNITELLTRLKSDPTPAWLLERSDVYEPLLKRVVYHYLTRSPTATTVCPVSKFHLGNGAELAAIHFLANTNAKGLSESAGMMVNYEYSGDLDVKKQRYLEGVVSVSPSLRSQHANNQQ